MEVVPVQEVMDPTNSCDKSVSLEVTSEEVEKTETDRKKGKVIQRNYVLNDVAALKKKLRAEGKKHEVTIGKEAKDASNITVPMKASFFEFVKGNFIDDLANNSNILKIDNAVGTKLPRVTYRDIVCYQYQ